MIRRVRKVWHVGGLRRLRRNPIFGVRRLDAGVFGREVTQGNEPAVAPLLAKLDQDGVLDHRVIHDLTFLAFKLHGRVSKGGALLELLVGVVLIAHAALHLATAAHNLVVRRYALLLSEPDINWPHAPGPAPGRAAERNAARVAPARVRRPVYKREPAH